MSCEHHQYNKKLHSFLPQHVAIIMDGNGRWAKNHGESPIFGHKAGVKSVHRAVSFASHNQLNALTLYAFSSENWTRSIEEVSDLMDLFAMALDSEAKNLLKHNIRLRIIGDTSRFDMRLQESIWELEEITRDNDGLNLNIAANYGGRWDIVQCIKKIARQVQNGILCPDKIDEDIVCSHICLKEMDPVDLVIRTGGEHRISNFLLWQIAYSELFFTDVLWPDFDENVFEHALESFSKRERRFGGTIPNNN